MNTLHVQAAPAERNEQLAATRGAVLAQTNNTPLLKCQDVLIVNIASYLLPSVLSLDPSGYYQGPPNLFGTCEWLYRSTPPLAQYRDVRALSSVSKRFQMLCSPFVTLADSSRIEHFFPRSSKVTHYLDVEPISRPIFGDPSSNAFWNGVHHALQHTINWGERTAFLFRRAVGIRSLPTRAELQSNCSLQYHIYSRSIRTLDLTNLREPFHPTPSVTVDAIFKMHPEITSIGIKGILQPIENYPSLVHLSLLGGYSFDTIWNPDYKINRRSFCVSGGYLDSVVTLRPKLQTLHLRTYERDLHSVMGHIARLLELQELELEVERPGSQDKPTMAESLQLLKPLVQLKKLELSEWRNGTVRCLSGDARVIETVIEQFPHLEHLSIALPVVAKDALDCLQRIISGLPKLQALRLDLWHSLADDQLFVGHMISYLRQHAPSTLRVIVNNKELSCIDALKTSAERTQYETCRAKVQEHIKNSDSFAGPWCCELPEGLYESVIFRLVVQLEMRGFSVYKLFYSVGVASLAIRANRAEEVFPSPSVEIGWDQEFTAQKIYNKEKDKQDSQLKSILDSNKSDQEKLAQGLSLVFSAI